MHAYNQEGGGGKGGNLITPDMDPLQLTLSLLDQPKSVHLLFYSV